MAEFRTPFFRSYLINDTALIKRVLQDSPDNFPKSNRISEGLRPLLGQSVFLTNGETWKRQRRIIDPAFEGGRLRDTYPAIYAAGEAAVDRLQGQADATPCDIEVETSHVAADVIFRTLFSVPISDRVAYAVFEEFQRYQRSQPLLNFAAFIPIPRWLPRFFHRDTKESAHKIRQLITKLTDDRRQQIETGSAPDDLATKIMTTADPVTGQRFEAQEMVDQVAIFFFAGHETSASALSWALYLLATHPEWQDQVANEATALTREFGSISALKVTRNVFRETLRLYPPVPMMVREAVQPETFRGRNIRRASQIVISPWHLHRHTRLWENPDGFDPARWDRPDEKSRQREAYMPFSTGPRVCTGAGFAMIEGVVLLAQLVGAFRFEPIDGPAPQPVAHLTVRTKDGMRLKVTARRG